MDDIQTCAAAGQLGRGSARARGGRGGRTARCKTRPDKRQERLKDTPARGRAHACTQTDTYTHTYTQSLTVTSSRYRMSCPRRIVSCLVPVALRQRPRGRHHKTEPPALERREVLRSTTALEPPRRSGASLCMSGAVAALRSAQTAPRRGWGRSGKRGKLLALREPVVKPAHSQDPVGAPVTSWRP